MEEDIEYLKKLTKPPLREEWDFAYKLDKRTAQAIENIIKGYRELEEYIKRLDKLNSRDFIFKSAIKEKIEELKKEFDRKNTPNNNEWYIDSEIYDYATNVLQELLEER